MMIAIRESMENGTAGICLFTSGRMTSEDWTLNFGLPTSDF